jgi:hypothetical protein
MKAWVRRQVDQLCNHLQNTLGGQLSDDIPTPLNYGQSGDPGVGTKASRSDHRHALDAAIFGLIPTIVLDINTLSSTQNTNFKIFNNVFGSATGLGVGDTPGAGGAFGVIGVDFSIGGAGTNSHVAISNSRTGSAAGDRSDRIHSIQRMARLVIRCRMRGTNTAFSDHKAFIGGYHETTGGVAPDIDSKDDVLGFYIEHDSSGVGNFHALAKSSTTGLSTDVDLGISWDTAGNFMNFQMSYDTSTASFFIDDVHYVDITDNIPTAKVFGWGLFAEKSAAVPSAREIWMDDLLFLGRF